ncbi:MAG TPA: putative peptidoglycan glycosyltransferase FtsW [Acidisoma sp.]|jgi:cell division protein FtsW|nr:putative peptidoglycan glycosyltransferase FtsW [Acidisoma sp.]
MPALSRTDTSLLGRWWWTVDRWTLVCIGTLIGFGYVLVLASSPAVAHRIGDPRDMLIIKQIAFLAIAGGIVISVSMMPPKGIRWLALVGTLVAVLLTAFTLVHGAEIKGARRWINIPFLSLQPSEFLKPFFAVVTAGLLVEARRTEKFPGRLLAVALYAVIALLLKSQPDIGMLAVVSIVFLAQLFLDGLNLGVVIAAFLVLVLSFIAAFFLMSHVHIRVERFLHPTQQTAYQALTALEAFGNGGLLGRGPGEGMVKDILPDAHADFVFAVAGEEFGLVVCLLILFIFAAIVLRGLLRLVAENDQFVLLAAAGILISFGLQAFINMASSLELIPTKGMTLPFISYGGSSALSVALEMGMLLALTRRRVAGERA